MLELEASSASTYTTSGSCSTRVRYRRRTSSYGFASANVGPTSATVTGTVNPGGVSTTWYVEYGTSTTYGSKTASSGAGAGTANVPVSATLPGLAQGTTYHYRVVAMSTAGTSRGADGVFT